MVFRSAFGGLLLMLAAPLVLFGQLSVDAKLPDYKPVAGVSGTIKSIGSDTMNNLLALWSEDFQKFYPGVTLEVEGHGSGTAPPALIAGTASFGPMSRPMKQSEIDDFERKFGYKPVGLGTSIDMLAVFVNKDNPIEKLSLPQVDAMFSSTRKTGYSEDVKYWGAIGLSGQFKNSPISLYGRNSASGTYAYFKKNVLGEGDYKASVKEQPGSAGVIQGVAKDLFGIGYSGIGYKTADVTAVPLAKDATAQAIPPTAKYAYTGEYPLARFLYIYVNYPPGSQLDPLRREFVKFIFSKQGQEAVLKDGYFPVNAVLAKKSLSSIGID